MDTNAKSPAPVSNQSIWHQDGDFIIKVVSNGELHLYRIHSFLLKLHSETLRDMFSIGGSSEQEKLHGCPVVQFYDDPNDVQRLLQVLYYPGSLPHEKLRQKTFDELAPVLRLADKYEMRDLVNRLLPLLQQDWPCSISGWDTNEAEIALTIQLLQEKDDMYEHPSLDEILPEPCSVIRLARQCNIYTVLPAAFYHLSRISEDKDDGQADLWIFERRAARRHLAAEDWYSLYRGMRLIRMWCDRLINDFDSMMAEYPISQHDAHSKCPTSLIRFIPLMRKRLEGELFGTDRLVVALDPLKKLKQPHLLLRDTEGYHSLCRNCERKANEFLLDRRLEFWTELPSFFQLPDWPA